MKKESWKWELERALEIINSNSLNIQKGPKEVKYFPKTNDLVLEPMCYLLVGVNWNCSKQKKSNVLAHITGKPMGRASYRGWDNIIGI